MVPGAGYGVSPTVGYGAAPSAGYGTAPGGGYGTPGPAAASPQVDAEMVGREPLLFKKWPRNWVSALIHLVISSPLVVFGYYLITHPYE